VIQQFSGSTKDLFRSKSATLQKSVTQCGSEVMELLSKTRVHVCTGIIYGGNTLFVSGNINPNII